MLSSVRRHAPPPYALMQKWLAEWAVPETTRVRPPYDDILDVFRGMVAIVPVDEAWYLAEYPAVARHVARTADETAARHFWMHGYFDALHPYPVGWHGLERPVPFVELRAGLNVVAGRGRLFADLERHEFIAVIRRMLGMAAVDDAWYRATYPSAAADIAAGRSPSAAEHYSTTGYFKGLLPADVEVDEDWYVTRYAHVRNGLATGVAKSAKDHFMRIGYGEGCQPTRS